MTDETTTEFSGGQPAGQPVDVLTGFLSPSDEAYGRPVGVAVDKSGNLFVADDVGNTVWRVAAAPISASREWPSTLTMRCHR